MKKSILSVFLLSMATFFFASCSKSSDPASGTTGGTNNAPANTMIVTIDGHLDTLVATATKTSFSGQTSIDVSAANAVGTGAGFILNNISTSGTYSVGTLTVNGTSPQTVVMVDNYKDASGQSATYSSPAVPGSSVGSVNVTINGTSLKAIFNGTLNKQNGSSSDPATSVITNGSVNVTIQ